MGRMGGTGTAHTGFFDMSIPRQLPTACTYLMWRNNSSIRLVFLKLDGKLVVSDPAYSISFEVN